MKASWTSRVGTICKCGDILVELQMGCIWCPWPGGATQYCSTCSKSQCWVHRAKQWASHTYSEQTCQLASLVFCDSGVNVLIAALHVETCDEKLLFLQPRPGLLCQPAFLMFEVSQPGWLSLRGWKRFLWTPRNMKESVRVVLWSAAPHLYFGRRVFIFFSLILKKISSLEIHWNTVLMNRCRDMCLILQRSRGSRLGSYKRNHTLQDRGGTAHDLLGSLASPAWQKASCRGGRHYQPSPGLPGLCAKGKLSSRQTRARKRMWSFATWNRGSLLMQLILHLSSRLTSVQWLHLSPAASVGSWMSWAEFYWWTTVILNYSSCE